MKQFLIKAAILSIISFATISFTVILMLYSVDDRSRYSHERNFLLAYNRLVALKDSNKIVIIGGSNGGFSINSRMISKEFKLPVVNTCTHAGIGTRMQFETYKHLLRNGDIVIFCPEYDTNLYGGVTLLRILSAHMPEAYKKITFDQWLYLYRYIGIHFNNAFKHLNSKEFEGPYSAKAINEYGDIEWEREHKNTIVFNKLRSSLDKKLVEYYKYIHKHLESKGIKIVFLPPTFLESNFKSCTNQINSLAKCLEANGIPWQSQPSKYSFADSLYYDTPYHMTTNGAIKRTEVLIEDLHRILGNETQLVRNDYTTQGKR